MADRIITGIDVGTYQVKVVIVRVTKNKGERSLPQIIGTGYAESRGLRNGYIINDTDVIRSVRSAVAQAEKAAGVDVKRAYVAMGGVGIDEITSRGEVITSRADSEITPVDLEKAMQDSEERILEIYQTVKSYMPSPSPTELTENWCLANHKACEVRS